MFLSAHYFMTEAINDLNNMFQGQAICFCFNLNLLKNLDDPLASKFHCLCLV